ncbi:putative ankyrin repeat protein [Tupanvirus soda lake]|uniref:Ankyrin repeat protein n=2 Tax=Tupanvirus TaxID=2094720 RepID=A0AC62AAJ7_9VIRU|nr:putative ankyrin repeat protein [Tupanvirus soda lake]QKU34801.1 putative ankyrin repeat protein [Tupanvirus soda lake]
MIIKLESYIDDLNLIDTINFFDQKNINFEFDKNKLYSELVKKKEYDLIDFFIDRGTKPEEFVLFCNDEDFDVINFLLDRFTDCNKNHGNFLVELIMVGCYELAKYLIIYLKNNNKTKYLNHNCGEPIIRAVDKGNFDILRLLIQNGAKIKKCKQDPIINALSNNFMNLVPFLIDNGSNIKSIMPKHLKLCINRHHEQATNYIINLLIDGKLAHFDNMDLSACLVAAAKSNNINVFKELINHIDEIDHELYRDLVISSKGSIIFYLAQFMNKKNYAR